MSALPRFAIAGAVALALAGCATLNQRLQVKLPRVDVTDVRAVSADIEGLLAEATLNIENPNSFALNIDGFDWQLTLANRAAVTGESTETVTLPAGGSLVV